MKKAAISILVIIIYYVILNQLEFSITSIPGFMVAVLYIFLPLFIVPIFVCYVIETLATKDASINKQEDKQMVLTKGEECGNDISAKTDSCPESRTKTSMKYFSEDKDFIKAECEHCKRILNIKRDQTTPNSTGFSLNPPDGVPCKCGTIHHNILGITKDFALRTRRVISFIIVVIGGGSLVALVLFIIGYTIFAPPRIPTPQEIAAKQYNSDDIDARVYAKIYVEQRLKSPSTAKFQNTADFAVAPAKDKKGKPLKDVWEVSGYVDAQNSFGAMLRNNWYVKLVKQGDKWIPTDIKMW